METVTVTVLQDDIDNGAQRDAWRCAVSLALRRELHCGRAMVLRAMAQLDDGRLVYLPPEASEFIFRFDEGREAEPLKFEAELYGPLEPGPRRPGAGRVD